MTDGAALREPGQIDAGAAADFEHRLAAVAVEVHEPQQMMQLLEMILIEIVEEAARADRMPGDLEIVDVPFPVRAHVVDGRHADNNSAGSASSPSCIAISIGLDRRGPSTSSSSAAASTG